MAGQKPTHVVMIPQSYKAADGKEKTVWYKVGSAWQKPNGNISFNLVTNPGVNFNIFPDRPRDVVVEREITLGADENA